MNRDNQPWKPVESASLEWTEVGDPRSTRFDDLYYSHEDGMAESRHVFLEGNDLPVRWRDTKHKNRNFCIAETGFGTGLNFLLTWRAWLAQDEPKPDLHYVSIEKHPLTREDMARALAAWAPLQALVGQLLEVWPGRLPGQHRLLLEGGRIRLDLWWEDVNAALPDLACRGAVVDAWYLDGFAPARNESMWREEMYQAIAALSRPGASFSTFTAAGHVRRGLQANGFSVEKVAGFGRKRECLRGQLATGTAPLRSGDTPWDLSASVASPVSDVIVIGGGLAGCTTAAALARRGVSVTLLEAGTLADAASGNEQGILYTRLSRRHSTLTDFALQSFRFAASSYRQMFGAGQLQEGMDGALCGSFHQQQDQEEMALLAECLAELPDLARVFNADQAAEVLGITPALGGYWFPDSGWLRPPAVCRALVKHARITVREHCGPLALHHGAEGWAAIGSTGVVTAAPCAVVATGTAATQMPALDWLPLQAIRGQTTHLPAFEASTALKAGFCHAGYIAPARDGKHCVGASFNLRDEDTALRTQDHKSNIAKLASAVPAWEEALQQLDPGQLAGRVGFRCASPDYLPLAGAVPHRERFLDNYAALRKNAKSIIEQRGEFVPGLYVNTAHGSRGLSSAPLVAEMLASQICDEPSPLSRELGRALSPARFLIRDLARNRI